MAAEYVLVGFWQGKTSALVDRDDEDTGLGGELDGCLCQSF